MLFWNDLETGQSFTTDTLSLTAEDIIDFAKDFDPQPYHLDPVVRMFVDTMQREGISSSGSSGVESLRWYKPVFVNDTLSATITISECKLSDEHSGYGVCDCDIDVTNQQGKSVIKLSTNVLIKCKPDETQDA